MRILATGLSDSQLYALFVNDNLRPDLKQLILSEYKRRHFSDDYVDKLKTECQKIMPVDNTGLTASEKTLIIATAPTICLWFFGVPIHAWIVNRYISKGQLLKWHQYWTFLGFGFLVWFAVVIAVAKLSLRF